MDIVPNFDGNKDILGGLGYIYPEDSPRIIVDPCFAVSRRGLSSTVRLIGRRTAEISVFLPASPRTVIMDLDDLRAAIDILGQHAALRIVRAVQCSFEHPLQLVVDTRMHDQRPPMLTDTGHVKEWAAKSL